MKVIDLRDSAQKQATSEGTNCILSPEKVEAVCFESQELEDLIAELSSGRIALDYLAEHLKLSCHQLHYVVEYLLKAGRISGELTYNTFTSSGALKLMHLEKMKAQKRMHIQKMREKRK